MIVPLAHILVLAILLFAMGMACLLAWRQNIIMMLIGIEVMLNAAVLVLVGGSASWGNGGGQVFAVMVLAMAAAEISLALALVVFLHRRQKSLDADHYNLLGEDR